MSKYGPLWQYISTLPHEESTLSFDQIKSILGFSIDHSFLTYKKELVSYGFRVKHISMKQQNVTFAPVQEQE